MLVIKRNGDVEQFNAEKIKIAVGKAMSRTDESDDKLQDKVVRYVNKNMGSLEEIAVDDLHKLVEDGIMNSKAFDVAREYVTYRKAHQPDIFKPRLAYRPYEYPSFYKYVDAMQQSYWIASEYDYTSSIHDYHTNLSPQEKEAVKRCMLAISQVEVSVKKFWSRIGDRLPKPELEEVGTSFGESELRHSAFYAKLLDLLGLNDEFKTILEVPAIKKRVAYATKSMSRSKTDSNRDYMESVLLFSLFIENVSLFSQFLVISQINKQPGGKLSGMANGVGASSLEEQLHAQFGAELINTIRKENPSWFDQDLQDRVTEMVDEAYEAEVAIIDWIFEEGDLPYLTKPQVVEYIKKRFNMGLVDAGFDSHFELDESLLEVSNWFDVQNKSTSHTDFFAQRSINYTKFDSSFDEDSLFD